VPVVLVQSAPRNESQRDVIDLLRAGLSESRMSQREDGGEVLRQIGIRTTSLHDRLPDLARNRHPSDPDYAAAFAQRRAARRDLDVLARFSRRDVSKRPDIARKKARAS
jgi:hypothetical protein